MKFILAILLLASTCRAMDRLEAFRKSSPGDNDFAHRAAWRDWEVANA